MPENRKSIILAMATIATATWLFTLSGGITNIALPVLAAEFGVSEAEIVWITVAFQIAAVSTTIPFAALAEAVGLRQLYIAGLSLFAVGCLICGVAGGFESLLFGRIVQGFGAAAISSTNAALVRLIVPKRMLGRGIATFVVVTGAALGAAPIIGSAILEIAGWRWLFLYDLPLTLGTIVAAVLTIPTSEKSKRRFDVTSAVLCLPALGLTFFGMDRLARQPTAPVTLAALAIGLLSLIILIRRQKNRPMPLLATDLLRLRLFYLPAIASVQVYGAQAIALVALPFLFVGSQGMSLVEAGVLISIMPLCSLLTSPLSGYACDRLPLFPFNALGSAIVGLGLCLVFVVAPMHSRTMMTLAMAVMGLGFAFFQNHNAKSLILGAPPDRTAAAGGLQSTMRVMGQMIGPALVGISFQVSSENGSHISLIIGIVMCVIGVIASLIHNASVRSTF